jgi:uncharacterized protein YndB with AHSA1/START domain
MAAQREIEIEATPEEVWEAVSSDEGRERWLDEPDRTIAVVSEDAPTRIVWDWWSAEEPPTRVAIDVVAVPGGTRVVVTETAPSLPLPALAARFALVAA